MEVGAIDPVDQQVARPANVPADRVMDFDIYGDLPAGVDFHEYWRGLMSKVPHPLMWTPHNGGHWIAFSPASAIADRSDMSAIQKYIQMRVGDARVVVCHNKPRLVFARTTTSSPRRCSASSTF